MTNGVVTSIVLLAADGLLLFGWFAAGVAIGSAILEFVVTVLVIWLVWRFVVRTFIRRDEAVEPESGNYAGVPARLRPRPKSGAAAVAVAEPDDEDEDLSFPPRRIGR
jgi:hypothetical protein